MIGSHWGVTPAEVAREYPCDTYVPLDAVQLWRGVTVNAPAAAVWPWLRQLQVAPYSYDWLDNLGHSSPREVQTLPEPQPGEPFSRLAGRFPVGRVLLVQPGSQLTAEIMDAVMSYVLSPEGASTRLLLKVVLDRALWYATPLAVGDWVMARRQLLNLKGLAERDWAARATEADRSRHAGQAEGAMDN